MSDVVIKLENVVKQYKLYNSPKSRLKEALHPLGKKYHTDFYALRNISLEIKRGEILGIVGRNGCGKSTLLKIISGVLNPNAGNVSVDGKIVALLELGAGFNPEFTGLQNIYFYGAVLGYTKDEMEGVVENVIEFSELGDFIYQPLRTYSSGMKARLSFAVSVNVDPEILILDEVLSVGDSLFRRKCYAKMNQFFKCGKTILFVSHDGNSINQLCTRAVMLDKGELLIEGPTRLVTSSYNKFIYAKKGTEKSVRDEIRNLNNDENLKMEIYKRMTNDSASDIDDEGDDLISEKSSEISELTGKVETILSNSSSFIPDFLPVTTDILKNDEVDILENKITTLDGEQVNCLVRGEDYIYECVVSTQIDIPIAYFGFKIKTEKGMIVSKLGLSEKSEFRIDNIFKNERYIVKIKFSCFMNSGVYYTNIGIAKLDNSGIVVLNRIDDSLVFRVVSEENLIAGLVTLNQSFSAEKIQ